MSEKASYSDLVSDGGMDPRNAADKKASELRAMAEALESIKDELRLRSAIYYVRKEIRALAAAAPEPRPVAWKHDCAALLTNDVELWVSNCPHCGKPRHTHPDERVARLEEALKTIELDARVARPYVGQVKRLGEIARAALEGKS